MNRIYVYCVRFILSVPLYSVLSNPTRVYTMRFYGLTSDYFCTIFSVADHCASDATMECPGINSVFMSTSAITP